MDGYNKKVLHFLKKQTLRVQELTEKAQRITDMMESIRNNNMYKLYVMRNKKVQKPKCKKCNKDRKVLFTSPGGSALEEQCECAASTTVYETITLTFSKFVPTDDDDVVDIMFIDDNYDMISRPYNFITFYSPEIDLSKTNIKALFFKEKEDCERWCVILNAGKW